MEILKILSYIQTQNFDVLVMQATAHKSYWIRWFISYLISYNWVVYLGCGLPSHSSLVLWKYFISHYTTSIPTYIVIWYLVPIVLCTAYYVHTTTITIQWIHVVLWGALSLGIKLVTFQSVHTQYIWDRCITPCLVVKILSIKA